MDYEKKYKEALEWARKVMQGKVGFVLDEVLEKFPELAESEDEKTRKDIINLVKKSHEQGGYALHKDESEKMLAWLEKQGGQKSVKEQQKEIDYAYRRGLADCHKAYNKEPSETDFIRKEIYDIIAALPLSDKRTGMLLWLESQKFYTATNKQKPIEPTDLTTWKYIVDAVLTEREGIGQYIDSPWTTGVAEKLQKRFGSIEQKPAWSEEDETVLNNLIYALANDRIGNNRDEYVDWLKSLCPQKKQEWSKEDEKMFATISDLLWEGYKASGGKPTWEEIRDWFMANYPQKQWKPSEEHLRHLSYVVDCFDVEHTKATHKVLLDLYEQLKAL